MHVRIVTPGSFLLFFSGNLDDCVCVWVPYSSIDWTRGISTTRTGTFNYIAAGGVFYFCPTRFYYSTAVLARKVPHFSQLNYQNFLISGPPPFLLT